MRIIISKRKRKKREKRGYRVDFTNGLETLTINTSYKEDARDIAEDLKRVAECEIVDLTKE